MNTMFNIGDEIEFTVRAKVKSYSISENGDCYTVELSDKLAGATRNLYIDTNMLKSCGAEKYNPNLRPAVNPFLDV